MPGVGHGAPHRRLVGLPAGRADDDVDPVTRQRRHIRFHVCRREKEIDRHVDAAPALLFRTARMRGRLRVDDAGDLVAALRR